MLTVWSSAICISEGSLIIDMTGITNAYDPPITVGRRVPNRVCSSVFMPVTNSTVCTTIALSCWKQTNGQTFRIYSITEKQYIKRSLSKKMNSGHMQVIH